MLCSLIGPAGWANNEPVPVSSEMQNTRLQDFGPYRIVRPIAKGGMAEIYLARHRGLEGLERTVVIKQILEQYADDEEFVTMFLDEARLLAALSHPNIAQVFDLGKVDRTYYLAMEYVRGPVLGRLLAAAKEQDPSRRLPRCEALGIGLAIAEGLHYTHARRDEVGRPLNIVHRDLNPSNVIVSYDGGVKLIDFGIAKAATKVYETRTGVIKGTYGYIAPEQLVGTTRVDHRADVFALGILLYEMCVGVHPFDVSDEPNLIDRILDARYRRPREVQPDVPPDLDELIASCLSPSPEERPADMGALIEELASHLAKQRMVPTQTRLAAVTRRLLPDGEGPRPLRPITASERPRPFGREPTRTQRLALQGREGASRPSKTAVTKLLPNSQHWDPPTARLDGDEPLILAGGPSDLGSDDVDEEAGIATVARELRPSYPNFNDDGEEAPTQLLSLSSADDLQSIAPSLETQQSSRPPPKRMLGPRARALGGGLLAIGIAGGGVYSAANLMRPPEAATSFASSREGRDGHPASTATDPVELRVVSEPPGAVVHVDGQSVGGTTPMTVTLPGEARIVWLRLSKPGHLDQERAVSATVGEARFVLPPLATDDASGRNVTPPDREPPADDPSSEVTRPEGAPAESPPEPGETAGTVESTGSEGSRSSDEDETSE